MCRMRATVWLAAVVVAGATLSGCVPKNSPSASGSAAPSASPSSAPSPAVSASPSALPSRSPESAPAKPKITKKALAYFFKIAMGSEYGDTGDNVVAKSGKPIVTVRTDGTLTSTDKSCLAKVVSDFNALTKTTDLKLTTSSSADSVIHFAPVSRFKSLNPDYVSGNDGFFTVRWYEHEISTANILIRTSGIDQTDRCHLIREELTQSMGLMRTPTTIRTASSTADSPRRRGTRPWTSSSSPCSTAAPCTPATARPRSPRRFR